LQQSNLAYPILTLNILAISSIFFHSQKESDNVDVKVLMEGLTLYKLTRMPIHVEFGVVWFAFGGYKVGLIGSTPSRSSTVIGSRRVEVGRIKWYHSTTSSSKRGFARHWASRNHSAKEGIEESVRLDVTWDCQGPLQDEAGFRIVKVSYAVQRAPFFQLWLLLASARTLSMR